MRGAMVELRKGIKGLLEELDALSAGPELDRAAEEDVDEAAAELEDALMLLGEVDPREPDWREDARDALETLDALGGDLCAMEAKVPGTGDIGLKLELLVQMGMDNLRED